MRRDVLCMLLACLALTGCQAATAGPDEGGPLVVVLFDVSRSTRDVRDGYLDAFEQVLGFAAEHEGHVVADVIDENPLAHSTYPIDAAFHGCNVLTDNTLTCDARATQTREDAVAQATEIVAREAERSGTDIPGGLSLAERVFASYPEAGERYLVVLSDMVAHSSGLSFARRFSEADVESTLRRLDASGLVPRLDGVSVYVVGAGVVSGPELSAGRIVAIQRFWERYFEAAGSELLPERYGSALVRFP